MHPIHMRRIVFALAFVSAARAAGAPPAPSSDARGFCKEDDILAGMRKAERGITYCFERELEAGRPFPGRFVATFRILAHGGVGQVSIPPVLPGDAPFRVCLAAMIQGVRFVAPDDGGICQINYPFVFKLWDDGPSAAPLGGPVARVGPVEVVAPGAGPRAEAVRIALLSTPSWTDAGLNARPALARELIEDELLRQHAERSGLSVAPARVDAELARLRARFDTDAGFDAFAVRVAGGQPELRAALALRMTFDAVYRHSGDLPMSPAMRDATWQAWAPLWARHENALVEHIFVGVPPEATPAEVEAANARLASIRAALAAPDADFAAVARRQSDAPTAAEGGALGRVVRGQILGPLDKAIFTTPVGVVSEPIRHSAGFHVVRVLRRDPARTADVAELERESPGSIAARHRRLARAALIRHLAARTTIEPLSPEGQAALPRLGASPWLVPDALGPDAPDWPFSLLR